MSGDENGSTIVFIIHANTSWEKLAKGSHVAVLFQSPGYSERDKEYMDPTLYDPSGSYQGKNDKGLRNSNGTFSAPEDASIEAYVESVLNRGNGEYVVAYRLNTTSDQETKMIEKAELLGDGFGINCADNVSSTLRILGFKHTWTPGGLEKQLKKSNLVTGIKVYEEY